MRSAAGRTIWATRSATPQESLRLLAWWRGELQAMYAGAARRIRCSSRCEDTAARHQLADGAFRRSDHRLSSRTRPSRATAISRSCFEYCRYSANPVGRLVLGLCGYRDAERQALSDATCTALQLANFWQDVTVDLQKDRVYLPLDVLERHGYPVEDSVRSAVSTIASARR